MLVQIYQNHLELSGVRGGGARRAVAMVVNAWELRPSLRSPAGGGEVNLAGARPSPKNSGDKQGHLGDKQGHQGQPRCARDPRKGAGAQTRQPGGLVHAS